MHWWNGHDAFVHLFIFLLYSLLGTDVSLDCSRIKTNPEKQALISTVIVNGDSGCCKPLVSEILLPNLWNLTCFIILFWFPWQLDDLYGSLQYSSRARITRKVIFFAFRTILFWIVLQNAGKLDYFASHQCWAFRYFGYLYCWTFD